MQWQWACTSGHIVPCDRKEKYWVCATYIHLSSTKLVSLRKPENLPNRRTVRTYRQLHRIYPLISPSHNTEFFARAYLSICQLASGERQNACIEDEALEIHCCWHCRQDCTGLFDIKNVREIGGGLYFFGTPRNPLKDCFLTCPIEDNFYTNLYYFQMNEFMFLKPRIISLW